jgi:hypothetical protein
MCLDPLLARTGLNQQLSVHWNPRAPILTDETRAARAEASRKAAPRTIRGEPRCILMSGANGAWLVGPKAVANQKLVNLSRLKHNNALKLAKLLMDDYSTETETAQKTIAFAWHKTRPEQPMALRGRLCVFGGAFELRHDQETESELPKDSGETVTVDYIAAFNPDGSKKQRQRRVATIDHRAVVCARVTQRPKKRPKTTMQPPKPAGWTLTWRETTGPHAPYSKSTQVVRGDKMNAMYGALNTLKAELAMKRPP